MIRVVCPCGKTIQAPDTYAGRRVKCPACAQPLEVPAAPATAAAPVESPMDDLLGPAPEARRAPEEPVAPEHEAVASPHAGGRRAAASSGGETPPRGVHLHLPFTSLSGVCLLVAFFLPWMRLSCGNMVIAEPSGFNLATNTEDSTMKDLGKTSKGAGGNPLAGAKEGSKEGAPWGNATPELWLFPLLGVALAAWGIQRMRSPGDDLRKETVRLLIVVLLAGGMLVVERARSYRKKTLLDLKQAVEDEKQKVSDRPATSGGGPTSKEFEAMEKALKPDIQVTDLAGFWLTGIALVGAALAMSGWLFIPARGPDS